MTPVHQQGNRPHMGLSVGPLLVAVSLLVWLVADRLVIIGPFDRAQITGIIALPLFLLAPGTLGVAAAQADARRGRLALALVPVALGVLAVVGLMATVTQVGCRPVAGPADVLAPALPVGLAVALAFGLPALTARQLADRGSLVAIAGAAVLAVVGAVVVLGVALVAFPVLSCAAG
jgi:hypothetical protein